MEKEARNKLNFINNIIDNNSKVIIAYKTKKSQSYFPNKDKISTNLASNIVYKYPREECDGSSYIDETKRNFILRINEHLSGKPNPTEISNHVHLARKENFRIIMKNYSYKIAETIILKSIPRDKRLNDMTKSVPTYLF